MLLILLSLCFSQSLSIRVLPCINCAKDSKFLTPFPSPEEDKLAIKASELSNFTKTISTGQWNSKDSKLDIQVTSGIFSAKFEEEEKNDSLSMILELTSSFNSNPKMNLQLALNTSEFQILDATHFQIKAVLLSKTHCLFEICKSENLSSPALISVTQLRNSSRIHEISVDSEECGLSLKLFVSDETLPEVVL